MRNQRKTTSSTRIAARVLSAALCGVASLAATGAGATLPSLTDQGAPPIAPVAADVGQSLQLVASGYGYRDGVYAGPSVSAYYGNVRVEVEIQGGRIVDVRVLEYPTNSKTSRLINRRALPDLKREVIEAQSASVDIISSATLTSEAFLRSADEALRMAGG